VPDHDFFFALQLSDGPPFERMLAELTSAVLVHVGYAAAAVDELAGVLRKALADGHTRGRTRCDVRFRARSGELHISVAYEGGAEWRTTRPLP
jgi:hypothetical protein